MGAVRGLLAGLALATAFGGLAAGTPASAESHTEKLDAMKPARRVAVGLEQLGFCLANAALQTAPDRNVLIAPTGAGRILAMIGAGSPLPVRQKMARVLGWPDFLSGSIAFGVSMNRAREAAAAAPDVTLDLATGVWHDRGHTPQTYFARHAGPGLQPMDPTDPATVDRINGWVSEATGGRIGTAVSELPPDTTILMADVLSFSGGWATPFEREATMRVEFAAATPLAAEVTMMQAERQTLAHRRDADGDWVTLPYGDGTFEAVMILPEGFGLGDFSRMACATTGGLAVPATPADAHTVNLQMPRMTLSESVGLDRLLHGAGLGEVLDDPLLGSSMLLPATRPGPIRQQVALSVDEEGAEVAAVTIAIGTRAGTEPVNLRFDRPFVLMIRERASGLPLLIGLINRPGSGEAR
jgi:serpin B